MAPGILSKMVPHLGLYPRYWWSKVNFSSTRITFDVLYLQLTSGKRSVSHGNMMHITSHSTSWHVDAKTCKWCCQPHHMQINSWNWWHGEWASGELSYDRAIKWMSHHMMKMQPILMQRWDAEQVIEEALLTTPTSCITLGTIYMGISWGLLRFYANCIRSDITCTVYGHDVLLVYPIGHITSLPPPPVEYTICILHPILYDEILLILIKEWILSLIQSYSK